MAVNKYGNDFKNNIMWNQEYPFIPEITNDDGFTIKEGDIVDFYYKSSKKFCALRVIKIYNKDYIWGQFIDIEKDICNITISSNNLLPYTSGSKVTPDQTEKINNSNILNYFRLFTNHIYSDLYEDELTLPNDWHFDPKKVVNKLNEEVARLKANKINIK